MIQIVTEKQWKEKLWTFAVTVEYGLSVPVLVIRLLLFM